MKTAKGKDTALKVTRFVRERNGETGEIEKRERETGEGLRCRRLKDRAE